MTDAMSHPTGVCIAGATGWAGSALVDGVIDARELAERLAAARQPVLGRGPR